jgi:transposase
MLRELNVVEQRYRAVLEVLSGIPVTEVAERYGVARQTVHRWMSRYEADGISGLAERSHAPKQHPWQIPAQVEAVICDLRRAHRRWGPRRLMFELDRRGYPGLSRSTIYRVLVRHQLIEPVPRRKRREQYRRWERPAPMLLWQMDVTASLFLADGRECKIVTGIDDHSRFCVIAGPAPLPPPAATVQRRVSCRGGIQVARQRIQVGMTHAGKIVTVITENSSFRLVIDGETVRTVPRTTSREIGRYKAYSTHRKSGEPHARDETGRQRRSGACRNAAIPQPVAGP